MSTKSVAEKLLIKPATSVWSSHPERLELIGTLPAEVRVAERLEEATTALVFADSAADLRQILAAHAGGLTAPATFWIVYPKANRADVNRDSLWPILAEHGMRPISQIAVDEVWSALRFRPLKPGETGP